MRRILLPALLCGAVAGLTPRDAAGQYGSYRSSGGSTGDAAGGVFAYTAYRTTAGASTWVMAPYASPSTDYRAGESIAPPRVTIVGVAPASIAPSAPLPSSNDNSPAMEIVRDAVRETRHGAGYVAGIVTTVHPVIRAADYLGLIDRRAIVRRIRGD